MWRDILALSFGLYSLTPKPRRRMNDLLESPYSRLGRLSWGIPGSRGILHRGVLAVFIAALTCSCKPTPAPSAADDVAEVRNHLFKHGGVVREVGIVDPRAAPRAELRPLVVVLHGGLGEDDDTIALSFGKLNRLAREDDFLVAYPVGIAGHWNDGRNVEGYTAQREGLDDVGFLSSLIADLIEKKRVDPGAVFMVGVSDGAMMAHRFACQQTGALKAFAAVIGAMPRNVARRKRLCGKAPVSVFMINGSEDPVVPWDGGEVRFDGKPLGYVISVPTTFSFWTKHNGCRDVSVSMIPDFSPEDGTRVQRHKATDCRGDARVELFEVQGAGHTWPSGWQYLPEPMIGRTSHDIDAAIAVWRFFQGTLELSASGDGI